MKRIMGLLLLLSSIVMCQDRGDLIDDLLLKGLIDIEILQEGGTIVLTKDEIIIALNGEIIVLDLPEEVECE